MISEQLAQRARTLVRRLAGRGEGRRRASPSDDPSAARAERLARLVAYCLPGRHEPILCIGPEAGRVANVLDSLGYGVVGQVDVVDDSRWLGRPAAQAGERGAAPSEPAAPLAALKRFDDQRFGVICLDLGFTTPDAKELPPLLGEAARITRRQIVCTWSTSPAAAPPAFHPVESRSGGEVTRLDEQLRALGFGPARPPAEPFPDLELAIYARAVPPQTPPAEDSLSLWERAGVRAAATRSTSRDPHPVPGVRGADRGPACGRGGGEGAASNWPLATDHWPLPRPIHFDVDLSQPGSFAWITAELATALAGAGHAVTIRPGELSGSLDEAYRAALIPLAARPPEGAVVVGWNHFYDTPALERDVELLAINYRFREQDPAAFDPWMRRILQSRSHLLAISRYCRQVLLDAGVPPERCDVLPLGYSPEVATVQTAAHLPVGRRVKVLAVTNAHDVARYGTDLLLEAFAIAFRPADGVGLVLRDYGAYNADVHRRVESLRRAGYDVLYFARFLSKQDVVRFYRACDVVVAPFRGEAFGVKILDALACGLPVIAPHYGGPADFLDDSNSVPVAYREVPVGDCLDARLLPLGNAPTWCEVDVSHLAEKLAATCANLEPARQRARRGQREVLEHYAWRTIAQQLVAITQRCAPARHC